MAESRQIGGVAPDAGEGQPGAWGQLDALARHGKVQLLFLAAFVCLRAWEEVFVVGSFAPGGFQEANGFWLHQMFYGAKAAGFFLAAVAGARVGLVHGRRILVAAAGAGMVLGGAVLLAAWGMSGQGALAAVAVASCLGGVSAALMLVVWFELCCALEPVMVLLCYAGGSLVFPFAMVAVHSLPFVAAAALGLAAPVLMLALLRAGFDASPPMRPVEAAARKPGDLGRLLVLLGALSFALGIWEPGQSNELFGSGSLASLGSVAVYLLVIVGFALKGSQFKLVPIFRALLPVTAVAFMLLPTDTPVMAAASDLCSSATYHLAVLLGILVCMNRCFREGAPPAQLFGALYGVLNATVVLGFFAWYLLKAAGLDATLTENAMSLIIAAVIALMFLLLPDRGELVAWGIAQREPGAAEPTPEEVLEQRIHALGKRCGLTLREEEVALLLAQGRTGAQIEAELFIAKGTLKTHRRNIYAKLDVHSQEELAELIAGA